MSFINNKERTVDGINTFNADVLNITEDIEVDGGVCGRSGARDNTYVVRNWEMGVLFLEDSQTQLYCGTEPNSGVPETNNGDITKLTFPLPYCIPTPSYQKSDGTSDNEDCMELDDTVFSEKPYFNENVQYRKGFHPWKERSESRAKKKTKK